MNSVLTKETLRKTIIDDLEAQGFCTNPHLHPGQNSKEVYRSLQEKSRLLVVC